ncbi:Uncharacterised protein [Mycobacteroides abscessus subsp. abscessus]|nr:Uncharacterised protein [Mycobacteroides abscessus subsp. abscessus]
MVSREHTALYSLGHDGQCPVPDGSEEGVRGIGHAPRWSSLPLSTTTRIRPTLPKTGSGRCLGPQCDHALGLVHGVGEAGVGVMEHRHCRQSVCPHCFFLCLHPAIDH